MTCCLALTLEESFALEVADGVEGLTTSDCAIIGKVRPIPIPRKKSLHVQTMTCMWGNNARVLIAAGQG